MIQVCLKDGFVVYEFNTVTEFVDAFPDGLDQDNLDQGCYINCSIRQAQEIA